ncbi:MAG: heterodisulfide reductase-related iron-sulfur binding cluster [Syntrophorhabdaceae bacterium]|nr:heterodisulfide reductase-related iron-sulfur binding cluster [Syntrophorhabdaceae bacterium]
MSEKLVYFTGCFTNYYNPDVGKALFAILKRHGIELIVPDQKCCGMPMMANGNREGAKKNFDYNIDSLYEASSPGYDIITTCPSCNMMLKKEGLPFFESEKARTVSKRVYDAGAYLYSMNLKGKLDKDFYELPLKVFYHNPCHLKVQHITKEPVEVLKLIPGIEIVGVNKNCCGMSGSYGMKKVNKERSKEIGQKVWSEVTLHKPDIITTECGGCGLQINGGTGIRVVHPIVLLNEAYTPVRDRKIF